jgi:hypothetical protein
MAIQLQRPLSTRSGHREGQLPNICSEQKSPTSAQHDSESMLQRDDADADAVVGRDVSLTTVPSASNASSPGMVDKMRTLVEMLWPLGH